MRPSNTPSNTAIAMLMVATETLPCFEGQDWDLNIYMIFFALNIDCGYTLESPR